MNYIDQINQQIRERQHRLQDEIDLLELDIRNSSTPRVYDTKSIENMFVLRLNDSVSSRRSIAKRKGFSRSHTTWTSEKIVKLIKYANDGTTNVEFKNNEFGATLKAVQTKLYTLGFVYRKNRWIQE